MSSWADVLQAGESAQDQKDSTSVTPGLSGMHQEVDHAVSSVDNLASMPQRGKARSGKVEEAPHNAVHNDIRQEPTAPDAERLQTDAQKQYHKLKQDALERNSTVANLEDKTESTSRGYVHEPSFKDATALSDERPLVNDQEQCSISREDTLSEKSDTGAKFVPITQSTLQDNAYKPVFEEDTPPDESNESIYEESTLDDDVYRTMYQEQTASDDQRLLTDIQKQYGALPDGIPNNIHILGTGSVGKLVAHSLRSLPNPPQVTLLFHRYKLLDRWLKGPKTVTLNRHGKDLRATGFDAEIIPEISRQHGVILKRAHEEVMQNSMERHLTAQKLPNRHLMGSPPQRRLDAKHERSLEPITHLIVTTKTNTTVTALSRIRHRIRPWTTICLMQNGMGVIDELNEQLFKDPARRPTFVQGVISHGANVPPAMAQRDPFYVVHAGLGSISLGLVGDTGIKNSLWTRWLLRQLTRSPALVAVVCTDIELRQLQLEKLAVNCIINPLTALIDSRNGSLNGNFHFTRVMRLMLAEIGLVIRSLPELQGLPNVDTRFHNGRLEKLVRKVADQTAENISSMLADVRNARQTEIEYINGYIIKRGDELGIKCVVNYSIMYTVVGKAKMIQQEEHTELQTQEQPDLNRSV